MSMSRIDKDRVFQNVRQCKMSSMLNSAVHCNSKASDVGVLPFSVLMCNIDCPDLWLLSKIQEQFLLPIFNHLERSIYGIMG
jgi:hypothetical protein